MKNRSSLSHWTRRAISARVPPSPVGLTHPATADSRATPFSLTYFAAEKTTTGPWAV